MPVVTPMVKPIPRASSGTMMLGAIIPLWRIAATWPGISRSTEVGSAIIPMLMFISPRQFGPPTGMPVRWAQAASSA